MDRNLQRQAILLLTIALGPAARAAERPLSNAEWARFACWLRGRDLYPGQLLTDDLAALLDGWEDSKVTLPRLKHLLDRGAALGIAVEKWERAGLWILTQYDREYPGRLKSKRDLRAPPFLIGCGSKRLLDKGGVAVVGSRNARDGELSYARKLAVAVSGYGKSIISGGARGVDLTAMEAALAADGTSVGVLADSLLRTSVSAKFRRYLSDGSLAIVSPFNPEARFNVGLAMARNRYIYCLSDCAVVVDSAKGEGGTWNGARENMKHNWVPIFVKPSDKHNSGNAELLKLGAAEAALAVDKLYRNSTESEYFQPTLLPIADEEISSEAKSASPNAKLEEDSALNNAAGRFQSVSAKESEDMFDAILPKLKQLLADDEMTAAEFASKSGLLKGQARAWLERAVREQHIAKLSRPARYANVPGPSLFGDQGAEVGTEFERGRRQQA